MNGFTLKLIAIVTMLIDHVAAVLIPENTVFYLVCRSIGRLAFPIFCFLLVEGLYHTKNVKKYLIRLGAFAVISEIPFDLAFADRTINKGYLLHQNVFFTLFIGLVVVYVMKRNQEKYTKTEWICSVYDGLAVVAGCVAAYFLMTDYSYVGILLIVTFYIFREQKIMRIVGVLFVTGFLGNPLEGLATLSLIMIQRYNGERGPKFNKYVFYAFYPVHILCIYLISLLPMFK